MKTEYARIAVACLSGLLCAHHAFCGPIWDQDLTIDSGSLPSSAQVIPGDVKIIRGKTGPTALAGTDTEDMYRITIQTPSIFCMRTVPPGELFDCCGEQLFPLQVDQGTDFDTQLFVFDSMGFGLLANDDENLASSLSSMGNDASDPPGPPFEIVNPGQYYIAVSGGPVNDPVSNGGAIFDQASVEEVSRPDGAGGGQPIIGWNGGGPTGEYEIVLCGTEFITGVPAVSPWTLSAMTVMMAIVGGIFIRRRVA